MNRFERWQPMTCVLPDEEALMYYVIQGVDAEEYTKAWVSIEILIGGMMWSSMTYCKAKGRFKE